MIPVKPSETPITDIHQILRKYWGYDAFRPLQEDIIRAVLSGRDVLALMPTGGGKSLCFQVPAMAQPGVCLVVTPLIALMRDQVAQLDKRGIPAKAIYSGMSKREIDTALDNCIYGRTKLLYLSPERLQTEIVIERVKRMRVALLAIDEAHCISQWGYDFRPPYLEIAAFRELLPAVPCMAVTATATPQVRTDICEKLGFGADHQVFVKSFARDNLSYSALEEQNKAARLLKILQSVAGSAVVYVRSRQRTQNVARYLKQQGISADYYHAGLQPAQREACQQAWSSGKIRVVAATNAFGMGIDKADVRLVIHLDLPESLEAYYQEAGRAGRDGKLAFATILYEQDDLKQLEKRVAEKYPPIDAIRKTYQSLANYHKMAVGSGEMETFDFDLDAFCKTYQLPRAVTFRCLQILEDQGLIQYQERILEPAKARMLVGKELLYQFQIAHPRYDELIKTLLRTHGGELLANYCRLDVTALGKTVGFSRSEAERAFRFLHQEGIIDYVAANSQPKLTYLKPRQQVAQLPLDRARLTWLMERDLAKMRAMVAYVAHDQLCRTVQLLHYFGEELPGSCGVCDHCLAEKKKARIRREQQEWEAKIKAALQHAPSDMRGLVAAVAPADQRAFVRLVRQMLESGEIRQAESSLLHWQAS